MSKVYKVRSRFLPWQVEELRSMFQSCPYPDKDMCKSMALRLNLQEGQVYKWFMQHRWKKRKQGILDPISPKVSDSKDYRSSPNGNDLVLDEINDENLNENPHQEEEVRYKLFRVDKNGKIIDEQEASSVTENIDKTLDMNKDMPNLNYKSLGDDKIDYSSGTPENDETK